MEYYLVIKNQDMMKFAGKQMELENIMPSKVSKSQKNMHAMYSLISGFAIKYSITMLHSTDPKKLNKKEGINKYI